MEGAPSVNQLVGVIRTSR